MKRLSLALALLVACRTAPVPVAAPPAGLLGDYVDDYTGRHTVTATEWLQHPRSRYHIIRWVPEQQYFIAQNDSANKTDAGTFTRIDWLKLDGMAPWEWAFCFSAYNAPTAAAAESTKVVNRATPKTGCNGYPFSRLKRVG